MSAAATGAGGRRPSLAVLKLASCDGCQLTLLDCEDELLALAGAVQVAHFAEMSSRRLEGPYDVVLVEGSVTNEEDAHRLQEAREASSLLVTIGACASAGGIQGLVNFAPRGEYPRAVYPSPEQLTSLERSTPVAEVVPVDLALYGCPIDRSQLLEVLTALLAGRRPILPGHSVCGECKRRGTTCLLVAGPTICLGPVTRAGCGALCPGIRRGCFGCFGPSESPNTAALAARLATLGADEDELYRLFATFNANAPAFLSESRSHVTPPPRR